MTLKFWGKTKLTAENTAPQPITIGGNDGWSRVLMTRKGAVAFAAIFAVFGTGFLLYSHAATPALSVEPENGNLTSGATVGNDNGASGGKYLQFGDLPGGSGGGGTGGGGDTSGFHSGSTLYYANNAGGEFAQEFAIGINLADVGMSTSEVNSLPTGMRALVWSNEGDCPSSSPPQAWKDFVDANANNPKVYGYYLADEPQSTSASCVAGIKAETDYIHSKNPNQKVTVLLTDWPGTYAAYRPSVTGLDFVGLDPYPCRWDVSVNGGCDYSMINTFVNNAVAAGIPKDKIVPMYQFFGDSHVTWRAPTVDQMKMILSTWQSLVPHPQIEMFYTWGIQTAYHETDTLQTRTDWQQLVKDWTQ